MHVSLILLIHNRLLKSITAKTAVLVFGNRQNQAAENSIAGDNYCLPWWMPKLITTICRY